jgi:hypothetical protein
MAITNKLVPVLDNQTYEFLRPNFTANNSAANGTNCFRKDLKDRYFYYFTGTGGIVRGDMYNDTGIGSQIGLPPFGVANTVANMTYSEEGYKGQVISSTPNTVKAAFCGSRNIFVGKQIKITNGKGKHQIRTIVSIAPPVVEETMVPTSETISSTWSSTQAIVDSTKFWEINRWMGYELKVLTSTGQNNIRPILFSSRNGIAISEAALAGVRDDWGRYMPGDISITAGSQSIIQIQASIATLDKPWDIEPDKTSFFEVIGTDSLYFLTVASAPWVTQIYDLATNTWQVRTTNAFTPSNPTDLTMDSFSSLTSAIELGYVTSNTNLSVVDVGKNWIDNDYKNMIFTVLSGAGEGQRRVIDRNTSDTIVLYRGLDIPLDTTSYYEIKQDTNKLYLQTNTTQRWQIYNEDEDVWMQNNYWYDKGFFNNLLLTPTGATSGFSPIPVTSITRTAGVTRIEITTVRPHLLSTGDVAQLTGATDPLYNISVTLTATGNTTLSANAISTPAANAVASNTFTTSIVFDNSKNWATNQWVGFGLLSIGTGLQSGGIITPVMRRITANTNNSLTVTPAYASAPTAGARYYIVNLKPAGVDVVDGETPAKDGYGICTSSSTTGVVNDTTKNWTPNIHVGKRVAIISGTGSFTETTVTSNTSNSITTAATTTTFDTSTVYAILGASIQPIPNNTNMLVNCADNTTLNRGKYIYYNPGSNNTAAFRMTMLRYNVCSEKWELFQPNYENASTTTIFAGGAQCTYDFKDRLYFTPGGSSLSLLYMDLNTFKVENAGSFPYVGNNNNFFRVKSFPMYRVSDDLIFAYYLSINGGFMYRTLIFY